MVGEGAAAGGSQSDEFGGVEGDGEEVGEVCAGPFVAVEGVLDGAFGGEDGGAEAVVGDYDDEVVRDEEVDLRGGYVVFGADDEAAAVEEEGWSWNG